jgi:hypothetical protein
MNSAVVLEIRRICDVAEIARVAEPLKIGEFRLGKIEDGALTCRFALSSYRGVANVAHWNKFAETSLMFMTDRFKQPFEFSSMAFIYVQPNAQTITVSRSQGVLENGMEHHAQVLLALSICSALCLAAWIWARRRLTRFQTSIDRK